VRSTDSAQGAVTLLVSNQSFDVNPVDIEIAINGTVVMRGEFDVAGELPPQHNWTRYSLPLKDGSHRIDARSETGRARLHANFEVPGVRAITIAFWHGRRPTGSKSEGYFTVDFGARPAATM